MCGPCKPAATIWWLSSHAQPIVPSPGGFVASPDKWQQLGDSGGKLGGFTNNQQTLPQHMLRLSGKKKP